MAVDLHTHSTFSDGSDEPETLVGLALAGGLRALALTDHDTLDGLPEARRAARGTGLEVIPGVELSVDWGPGAVHVLSYFAEGAALAERLAELRAGREQRNREILAALEGLGMPLADEPLREGPGLVGRPHIAAALVRRGWAPSLREAFDLYLAAGRPAYRPRLRLTAAEAVRLTREAGGAAVLAHPHTVAAAADDYAAVLAGFADLGGAGIECYYPDYPPELQDHLVRCARRLGMAATGGSDYHGALRPGPGPGPGRGGPNVPDEAVEELRRRASRP